jgi:outer membrane immunogenic protein
MNKLLITTAALIAVGVCSSAAASQACWTGLNIGVDAGWGWSETDLTNRISDGNISWPDLAPGQSIDYNQDGFIGGGHVGYNWQCDNLVFGAEIAGFGANIKDGASTQPGDPYSAGDDVFSSKIESLFLATAHFGVAWDRALFSIKGGYAGANLKTTVKDIIASQGSGSDSDFRSGAVVGGDVEFAVTNNWIVGVEYDYVRLQSHHVDLGDSTARYVFNDSAKNLNLVFARLSYRFEGTGVAN